MARSGFQFLLVWEMMTVSSFILAIFDLKVSDTLRSGGKYVTYMHVGWLMILLGFLQLDGLTGLMSFEALGTYFANHPNYLLFFTFFVGLSVESRFGAFPFVAALRTPCGARVKRSVSCARHAASLQTCGGQ